MLAITPTTASRARVTFSLDDATVAQIRQTAARLQRPQSHVVRDAVADYAARTDRLSERERQHLMGVLERLRGAKPTRPATGVDAELRAIRTARRVGGRRPPRGREIDLAVAACAIANSAGVWTLNPGDFRDLPDLRLV